MGKDNVFGGMVLACFMLENWLHGHFAVHSKPSGIFSTPFSNATFRVHPLLPFQWVSACCHYDWNLECDKTGPTGQTVHFPERSQMDLPMCELPPSLPGTQLFDCN